MKKGNPVIGEVFYDKWAIISVVYFYRDVDGLCSDIPYHSEQIRELSFWLGDTGEE